jgi:hypothetical protein
MKTIIEFYEDTGYDDVVLENVNIRDLFNQLENEFILVYPMIMVHQDLAKLLGIEGLNSGVGERFDANDGRGLIVRTIDIKRIYNEI